MAAKTACRKDSVGSLELGPCSFNTTTSFITSGQTTTTPASHKKKHSNGKDSSAQSPVRNAQAKNGKESSGAATKSSKKANKSEADDHIKSEPKDSSKKSKNKKDKMQKSFSTSSAAGDHHNSQSNSPAPSCSNKMTSDHNRINRDTAKSKQKDSKSAKIKSSSLGKDRKENAENDPSSMHPSSDSEMDDLVSKKKGKEGKCKTSKSDRTPSRKNSIKKETGDTNGSHAKKKKGKSEPVS